MKIFCTKIKSVVSVVVLPLIAILLALFIAVTNTGAVYFGNAMRLVPIYRVSTSEKKVALTFDAAWGSDKTSKIVETLNSYGIKGTFFLVGFWIEKNADKVKMIDEAGFDIGTHSNTHPKMSTLSASQISSELSVSMKLITDITGKPVKFFRAPFGDYNDTVLNEASSLGLKTIQWDVDSLDWKGLSANEILARVKASVQNGSIILCHNNSDHILDALPLIINYLISEGYKMVKISELVYENDYLIDNSGLQKLK
ncbi:MAG: polysaccharide deacetylase family protein [Clostridia bacterium]|nr:polysaccharide deacetylase family protein [Clostridia bacterium]